MPNILIQKIQFVDFHMHSTFSDGTYTVEQLIQEAIKRGLTSIAISDHDTLDHIAETTRLGKQCGLNVLSSTELSVRHKKKNIHMLAYNISLESALAKKIKELQFFRIERMKEIVFKLKSQGLFVEVEDVLALADGSVSRPNIAQALLNNTGNQLYFESGRIGSMQDIFSALLNEGCPAYVPNREFFAEEAISLIHDAGGVAVWAHPGITFQSNITALNGYMSSLKNIGLDGVETFYGWHNENLLKTIHYHANKNGLYESAGSDFHGRPRPEYSDIGCWNSHGIETDFSWLLG